jgi:K+-sensing histidine kinase KdpD
LSIAIENAQLFERTQASLDEVSRLYQRLAGDSWRTLLQGQKREKVFEAAPADATLISAGGEPLVVPLMLRERQVGVIELHGRRPEQWTPEERAALGTLAAQAAAALESAALLEETQRRRLREQLINEITYQMRATLNPTAVVQSGMRELGRVLGATEVVVRLAGEAPVAGEAAQP